MKIERAALDVIYRHSFGAFAHAAFGVVNPGQRLIPNWHIDCICYRLEGLANNQAANRLVLNLPPRTLKSFLVSVCLPAWLLGRNPGAQIICASYAEDLANKFSRDCRVLLESPFYKRIFPATRLNPKKITEGEFETTRRGYRLATSIGGVLTGRGGDYLIIDDPIKANDADSQAALTGANNWFCNTAMSRLDNHAKSLVIVAQQRLHLADLSGLLIERGYPSLVIPAVATEPVDYFVAEREVYHRPIGQVLQPERDSAETFDDMKRHVGTRIFAAQYQQTPTPPEGNMIKAAWLGRYPARLDRSRYGRVVLTCDPAGKAGPDNDYTAITVVGVHDKAVHILDVSRGHWPVLRMRDEIVTGAAEWCADLVIVEDTSSGMGLIQLLKEQSTLNVIGRHPKDNKEVRMCRHQGRFEAGRIFLPVEAAWLADFENELLAFPGGRYDDQVDALLLFLDWFVDYQRNMTTVAFVPPLLTRASIGLEPFCKDWSCHH